MRKRTIRSGFRLLLAALMLIILASFYHNDVARIFSLNSGTEQNFFSMGLFAAAALGGYGVVLAVFGFVLPADHRDTRVKILPVFILLFSAIALFFYLFFASFTAPEEEQKLRPGTTISI